MVIAEGKLRLQAEMFFWNRRRLNSCNFYSLCQKMAHVAAIFAAKKDNYGR